MRCWQLKISGVILNITRDKSAEFMHVYMKILQKKEYTDQQNFLQI